MTLNPDNEANPEKTTILEILVRRAKSSKISHIPDLSAAKLKLHQPTRVFFKVQIWSPNQN
jgi:hypothetical protein